MALKGKWLGMLGGWYQEQVDKGHAFILLTLFPYPIQQALLPFQAFTDITIDVALLNILDNITRTAPCRPRCTPSVPLLRWD
jgi:hypothetical protein